MEGSTVSWPEGPRRPPLFGDKAPVLRDLDELSHVDQDNNELKSLVSQGRGGGDASFSARSPRLSSRTQQTADRSRKGTGTFTVLSADREGLLDGDHAGWQDHDDHLSSEHPVEQRDELLYPGGAVNAGASDWAPSEAGSAAEEFAAFDRRANTLMLEFRNVSLSKGGAPSRDRYVLCDCFGVFRPGEVSALIGPSGAGKSSLMNVLAGRVAAGKADVRENAIRYGGRPVRQKHLQDAVAYVLQHDLFFAHQTVRETLDFYARLRLGGGVSSAQRRQNVGEVLEMLNLTHVADNLVGDELLKTISGGERKRVAVGCELISRPTVLMLDEPTSGLDSLSSLRLMQNLKRIAREQNAIVVVTIHQPEKEVWECVDRVVCMRRGRVLVQGWTKERAARGGSRSAASFGGDEQGDETTLGRALVEVGEGGKCEKKDLSFVGDFLQHVVQRPIPDGYGMSDWLVYLAQTMSDDRAEQTFRQTARVFEVCYPPFGDDEAAPLLGSWAGGDSGAVPSEGEPGEVNGLQTSGRAAAGSAISSRPPKLSGARSTASAPGEGRASLEVDDRPSIKFLTTSGSRPAAGQQDTAIMSSAAVPHRANPCLSGDEAVPARDLFLTASHIKDNSNVGCPLNQLQRLHVLARGKTRERIPSVVPEEKNSSDHDDDSSPSNKGETRAANSNKKQPASTTTTTSSSSRTGAVERSLPPFWCNQLPALVRRHVNEEFRRTVPFLMRILSPAAQILIMGAIFWMQARDLFAGVTSPNAIGGQKRLESQADYLGAIDNLNGSTLNMYTVLLFTASGFQMQSLGAERAVFLREYTSSMYSVWTYLFVRLIVELLILPVQVGVVFAIQYFMYGFLHSHTQSWLILANLALTSLAGGSLGLFLGAVTANLPGTAVIWAPFILTTIPNSFANPFRPIAAIPKFVSWLQWLIPIRYAYNVHGRLLFGELENDHRVSDVAAAARDEFFAKEDTVANPGVYLAAIAGLFLGFRILAGLCLVINSRTLSRGNGA